jgi:glycerate-2-kinase
VSLSYSVMVTLKCRVKKVRGKKLMTLLNTAKGIFFDTLHHLRIDDVMRTRVHYQGETLHIGDLAYDLQDFHRVVVISIGKAAAPMWDALLPELEPALQRDQPLEAIVVGSTVPRETEARVRFFPGSHPLPSQISWMRQMLS